MAKLLRNSVFTLNNWTDVDKEALRQFAEADCEYLIYGDEVGEGGTPHLQGYFELKKRTRMNTVVAHMGVNARAHLEERRGSQKQAITYCKKDGRVTEFGEPKHMGARADLDEARELALTEGMGAVAANYNYQGIRVAEKHLTYNEPARDFKPQVIWLWGASGSGKSRLARLICERWYPEEKIYTKNDATKWWSGYDRHGCVIIDDFRDSWWGITEMLRILDRYECQVECKGGYRQLLSKLIVVTSIIPPSQCYAKAAGEPITQLLRRIDEIRELKLLPVPVPKVGGNTNPSQFENIQKDSEESVLGPAARVPCAATPVSG